MKFLPIILAFLLMLAQEAGATDIKTSGGAAPTAASVAGLIRTQSGCSTAGYLWVPSSNTCVAPVSGGGGGATLPFPGIVYGTSGTGGTVATSNQIQSAIGSGVYDASGAATAAQASSLQKASNLSDLASAATARTNLGLGSAATASTSAFDAAGVAAAVQSLFTSQNGILKCNGSTCTGVTTVPNVNLPYSAAPVSVVYPEQYGAVGNGYTYFDGALTAATTVAMSAGTSATLTSPTVTTASANDFIVTVFGTNAAITSGPTPGTARTSVGFGATYGMNWSDQAQATAGTSTAVTATYGSSTFFDAATIALVPKPSNTITYVASSTYTNNSTAAATVTRPTGLTTGDYEIGCLVYYETAANASSFIAPSGWSMIYANATSSTNLICYGHVATSSEPSSYVFTNNAFAGTTAIVAAYRGTAGVDAPNYTLTSATANFVSGASTPGTGSAGGSVGDPICVANTSGSPTYSGQTCGTITAWNSATSVNVSFPTFKAATGLQFTFGTDDTAPITTMLQTYPCNLRGCDAKFDTKHYVMTASVPNLPPNVSVTIEGNGPGVTNTANSFLNGATIPNVNSGSQIDFLTTGMTKAGITINGTSAVASTTSASYIRNIALYGGTGLGSDGGGADAIDIINQQIGGVYNVFAFNFKGIGGLTASLNDYSQNIAWMFFYSAYNGGPGWQIGSTASDFMETTSCFMCTIEANGGPGINLVSHAILGLHLYGSTIQWDNRFASDYEVSGTGYVSAGVFEANYFESDINLGSRDIAVYKPSAGFIDIDVTHNYCYPTTACTAQTYSAATVALPTCSTSTNPGSAVVTANVRATVTDATTCVPGGTYTSGGTAKCSVTCTGGVWVESGSISGVPYTLASSATPVIPVASGLLQTITLSANTTPTITGIAAGSHLSIEICQPASGGPWTWAWPASVHGGMTIGTTAGQCSIQAFDSYNGTTLVAESTGVQNVAP